MERRYFPEHFEFRPFGDPFEVKRRHEEEVWSQAPAEPNGADVPWGT